MENKQKACLAHIVEAHYCLSAVFVQRILNHTTPNVNMTGAQ